MLETPRLSERESSPTLKLITRGRLTGLPHIAELRFTYLNYAIYVLAGSSKSDWVLNAIASRDAKVRIGEISYHTIPQAASNIEKEQVLQSFRRKYGSRIVDQWYGGAELCLRLEQSSTPIIRGAVRGEAEALADFSQWKNSGIPYVKSIEQAFDSASEEYDYTIRRNYINTWIRERSIRELLKLTKPNDVLLEIGCGTGTEAIEISKRVTGIIATDISQKMLQTLNLKVKAKRLDHKISALRVAASSIERARSALPDGMVRIAYSFNGALNCEPDIQKVPKQLAEILAPAGYFVCSIRNPICLSEALSHSLVLQFARMAPRKKQPVMVSVGGMDIPSYYYSPGTFVRFFEPYFKVKKIVGLPAFVPPAYLNDYYVRAGQLRPLIEALDLFLGSHFPFNRFGDQTLLVLQRRN